MIKLWSWSDRCPRMKQMVIHFTAVSSQPCRFPAPAAFLQFIDASVATLAAPSVVMLAVWVFLPSFCTTWYLFTLFYLCHMTKSNAKKVPFSLYNLVDFFKNSWHVSNSQCALQHQQHTFFLPFMWLRFFFLGNLRLGSYNFHFFSWSLHSCLLLLKNFHPS